MFVSVLWLFFNVFFFYTEVMMNNPFCSKGTNPQETEKQP